jgi:pentatricopeptide repeat protein
MPSVRLQAVHLLQAMGQGGPTLSPDSVSYNTVLKACANSFQLARALDVYKEMVQR